MWSEYGHQIPCFEFFLEPNDLLGEYEGSSLLQHSKEEKEAWAYMMTNVPVIIQDDTGRSLKVQTGSSVYKVKASCVRRQ